jgi:hypothetical protein
VGRKVYIIGSLRNPAIPDLGKRLRQAGFEVFDDWFAAGPEADDWWQRYEQGRGRSYAQALKGEAAKHVYGFDKKHLDASDVAILVLPAGKSGHLELGYCAGKGKETHILLAEDQERWDVMYLFATGVHANADDLIHALDGGTP